MRRMTGRMLLRRMFNSFLLLPVSLAFAVSLATTLLPAFADVEPPTTVRIDFDGTSALTDSHYAEASGVYSLGLEQGNLGWNLSYMPGNQSSSSKDMSWGEVGDGSNGLMKVFDANPGGNCYMHVNKSVGEINGDTSGQHMLKWGGLVLARIKNYDSPGTNANGFGYSCSDGNHSAVVCVRNGSVNLKTAAGVGGLNPVSVSANQGVWRVYALRWQAGGVCDAWISNGASWSSNPGDWTQLFIGATITSPQTAAVDQNNTALSGILLGSYGNSADTCNLSVDWVAITANTAAGATFTANPWDFNPIVSNDTTPPANVTNFAATPGPVSNTLAWTNPADPDLAGVKIMYKTAGYPSSPTDGAQAFNGSGASAVHSGLTQGITYYYTAFAYDTSANYSSPGVQTSGVPLAGPPSNVSSFSAAAGDGLVNLSWVNPAGTFTGVKILFKTTGYPSGPTDGTPIYDSNGASYSHTGLTNGIAYYYGAFAHDATPSFASGVQANAIPVGAASAGNVSIHPSGRYYQDASGMPRFLTGYYAWGDMVPQGGVSDYRNMIMNGGPYKINYIRITCGVNTSGPPNYTGHTFVPYVNGKAVWANQVALPNTPSWDPVFWNGMRDICQVAKANNTIVNICFFDGVNLRGCGEAYTYCNSPWNPANQDKAYYPAGDYGDGVGAFYRVTDFVNNTGVGYYQRALIDKVIATTADFDNVMFEIGNELSSDAAWNAAVIDYVTARTTKPIEQCGGVTAPNVKGLSDHWFLCVGGVKPRVAMFVGQGYPAWVDPDNNEWPDCFGLMACTGGCAGAYTAVDNGQRQGAWLSFAGGAACWGGFTEDYWEWPQPHRGFSTNLGQYYLNLQNFISDSAVAFWNMTPQHALVSNNTVNSCIANLGVEYVAYILSDASATLDLTALSGNAYYKLFDTTTGTYTTQQAVAGGAVRSFTKPSGATDWAIHVYTGSPATTQMLNIKPAGGITIDGSSSDWALSDFGAKVRGGQGGTGDIAYTGFDGSGCYYAGRNTGLVLPTGAADHLAKVYSRHDTSYLYFLVRCDDNDLRYGNPTSANWSNDCVEIYIDPGHDIGSSAMSNSTSDVRLVIDAGNQVNVYNCTPGYTSQVLAGVTSAVQRDASGWWLEAKIAKNALSPAIPSAGSIGIDFAFRDNDNSGDTSQSTGYDWADRISAASFPAGIPEHWGSAYMVASNQGPYPGPSPAAIPGVIQAENYDTGGEAVGYHDTSAGNSGSVYRTDDVDIQACYESGGGYNVFNLDAGEWLAYSVNVASSGNYDLKMHVAATVSGCAFHIEANGQNVTGTRTISPTGGSQNWTTVAVYGVHLNAGQQLIRVVCEVGGWGFNYLDIRSAVPQVGCGWNAVRPAVSLGTGQQPTVAVDSTGAVHVVYGSGSTIQYRKFDRNLVFLASETISAPNGNGDWTWFDMEFDSGNVPHVTFSQHVYPDANMVWYTNRIGGAWKAPTVVINAAGVGVVVYPRLVYKNGYCYTNSMIWGDPAGYIVRITNLSGTPTVDRTAGVQVWGSIAGNGAGHIFSCGRYGPAGHWVQELDSNLSPVGGLYEVSACKPGKTNKASNAYGDRNGVVHFVMDCMSGYGPNEMLYNNTSRRNGDGSFQCAVQGLVGNNPGPDGEPPGWWNDDVWEVCTLDATGIVYVAYREWSQAGRGLVTQVSPGGFTEPATQFAPTIKREQGYNCEIAPALNGGIYLTYCVGDFAYITGVGTGCWTPGPVTGLAATPGNGQIALSWSNPIDASFVGVRVLAKTTGYPTGPNDGTVVYTGNGVNCLHTGLVNDTRYYYAAYAHDSTPNYSAAAQTSAIPHVIPDWINESFDAYSNGDLSGQGGWAGVGTGGSVQSGQAKGGSGKAVLFDTIANGPNCGNQVSFTDKSNGYCMVDFDMMQDATGAAGEELAYVSVYGSDSATEITKIHIKKGRVFAEYGTGSLATISGSIANLTWNNVRVVFNCDNRTFDLYLDNVSKGSNFAWKAGPTRISKVVMGSDRNVNLSPQKVYIDNLRVEPKVGQVASVTDDGTWSPSLSKLHFTFPAVSGTPAYQYAVGTTSSGTQIRDWTNCGASTDVTATGLSLSENVNYYISVQCLTLFGTAGPLRAANGIKVAPGLAKINEAKALADGASTSTKSLRAKLVSAPFSGYFYIQEPNMPSGLKIVSTAIVSAGDLVDVCGFMKGSGAERYMDGSGDGVIKTSPGPGGPNSVMLASSSLGGSPLNANTPGVAGGIGPNNIGLYVTVAGKVTQRQTSDPKYFYIDDGSSLLDGTTTGGAANVGVRVIADPAACAEGSYVSVTGISSCFNSGGLRPQIAPLSVDLLCGP